MRFFVLRGSFLSNKVRYKQYKLITIGGIAVSYFQQNQVVLQERFPHVVDKMINIEKQETQVTQVTLYSEPFEKDEVWLEAVRGSVENQGIILLYGFGQGIGIADLIEMYPERLLFVYEPNEENFRVSLKEMDLRIILESPNLYFLAVGENQLKSLFYSICTHMRNDMAFIALRHYLEVESDEDMLRNLKSDLEKYSNTFDSNRATQNVYRHDWVRNSMYQIAGMLSSPRIKDLYKTYENATIIIIASGPSLQIDIEWVKRIKEHVLIISAGSSIQALVKNGIQPHLATILDGGEINNKVFSDPNALVAPLLYTSSAYYEISDKKDKFKIHSIIKNDEVSQYYMGVDKSQAEISPTTTVTGTAIQAACWLGAKRVVMMGQDLSFPGDKYYSDGVGHIDSEAVGYLVKESQDTVLNVQGTYNATNSSFMGMKGGLESLIAAFPDIEFINSTRNGAVIEGSVWKPIEEVYELVSHENIDGDAVRDLLEKKGSTIDVEAIKEVKSKVFTTFQELPEITQEFKKMIRLFSEIRVLSHTNPVKCQRKIVVIEKIWEGVVNRPWFSPVFEALLPIELREYDRELPSIILEQNLVRKSNLINDILGKLVKHIEAEIPFLKEVFGESLRRIEALNVK